MCAAMKSTAEASSGWSIQAVQISPVVTGTGLERFTRWMSLMRSSTLISARSIVSLPTTMALTLLLVAGEVERGADFPLVAVLVLVDPGADGDLAGRIRRRSAGTSSAPPVDE